MLHLVFYFIDLTHAYPKQKSITKLKRKSIDSKFNCCLVKNIYIIARNRNRSVVI